MGSVCLNSKKVSDDKSFYGEHNYLSSQKNSLFVSDLPIMGYICAYDSQCWIKMIIEIDTNENDFKVDFLHSHGPSDFCWLSREDIYMLGA